MEQELFNVNTDIMSEEYEYVRVRLNSSEQNKAKGFYLLMTNGNTYSDKKDEFIIERRFLKLLDDNKVKFKQLPT